MRDHNKAFVQCVATAFDCPGPVYEFGSYQVEGQEGFADLRAVFANRPYVGCDMRSGPGVDRVEDVSRINQPDGCAGTVLCIETFEHVFEVRRAFDEVFRILKPGGLFLFTSPLNFRIHGYPDDYWRMTPSCLRRMLEPYGARITGYQGPDAFPHSVMALGMKAPASGDFGSRAERFVREYQATLARLEAGLPLGEKLRRTVGQLYRSKGERRMISQYYHSQFQVDLASPVSLAKAG
jgi:SAM-dependent methyltransferase